MSRMAREIKAENKTKNTVTNFMGGKSYTVNPLDTLKLVAASSIFGEPSYYRSNVREARYRCDRLVENFFPLYVGKTTTEIFEDVIDNALSYDFGATLEFAAELRSTYNMRLNPQVIMVRAAIHEDRAKFTSENPGVFAAINDKVMARADEPATQLAYYIYKNGGKSKLPSVLKRSIADKLSKLDAYAVNKYKNAEIGMINAVRLTHANSPVLDDLLNDNLKVSDSEETWEQKRSRGMGWKEIFNTTNMGHMALLRNLRNVFEEVEDINFAKRYLKKLKDGVLRGKQFPFRYYTAMGVIEASRVNYKSLILDTLEECMDIAIDNMPKLKGKTMCLSDNSGSAWGGITSEYGSVVVAEIDNLSSVIAGKLSDEGYVGKFGDKLKVFPVSKRNGCLIQAKEISRDKSHDVGGSTEGGIWEFLINAINDGEFYDNIFIFSDMQAGHGGLYGTSAQMSRYSSKYGVDGGRYIDVYKLVKEYRQKVNPKVNVFMVQTAGYNNVILPEYSYRTAILSGWTGKEVSFAADFIKRWDDIEGRQNAPKQKSKSQSNLPPVRYR